MKKVVYYLIMYIAFNFFALGLCFPLMFIVEDAKPETFLDLIGIILISMFFVGIGFLIHRTATRFKKSNFTFSVDKNPNAAEYTS